MNCESWLNDWLIKFKLIRENGSAAWLADGNKYFEEQELSVQVATMDLTDDSVNYNNYSVKNNNNKNRQRLPAGNGQEVVRKVIFL